MRNLFKFLLSTLMVLFTFVGRASAQIPPPQPTAVIVGIFANAATDPSVAVPAQTPVTYTLPSALVVCGQVKPVPQSGLVNPNHGVIDDPADGTKACIIDITTQRTALQAGPATGTVYKTAYRFVFGATGNGPWTGNPAFSFPFLRWDPYPPTGAAVTQ